MPRRVDEVDQITAGFCGGNRVFLILLLILLVCLDILDILSRLGHLLCGLLRGFLHHNLVLIRPLIVEGDACRLDCDAAVLLILACICETRVPC
eukprot:XP_001704821.1 Hypothetical protein GL50803_29457 [Giardia lamblia ATCC 50803]